MKIFSILLQVSGAILVVTTSLIGQGNPNCFWEDYFPKYAIVPAYEDAVKPAAAPTVTATINAADTLGKISPYIFGNAVAVWVAQDVNNPVLMSHLQKLSPTLIRFPGGSWSDIYFWSGNPGDLPSMIYDGRNGQKIALNPQFGPNHTPTVDSYYDMRAQLGVQGLITVNYAYARYGLSMKPAEQAAHYAADWVRYDAGRTEFWEIGNENAGPWEAGWQIDPATNRDGQPDTITGELYGKHFRIFADSMRAAAAEIGTTIYIGGQVIHYDGRTSWNIADRKWNEDFFREVGDAADFYVMHNYYGASGTTITSQVNSAASEIVKNITFIRQDIVNKHAASRPIALTEWNCGGPDLAKTSIANGMQAVVMLCELIKMNAGMSARWLIANWESDGMFYFGNSSTIPRWNPRPDFYYLYYLQRFVGDNALGTSVAGSGDILAYASRFYSGQAGVIVVNKGTTSQVVKLEPKKLGVGDRFYVYTLTGGTDASAFPQAVYVNDVGPTTVPWGPLDALENIRAKGYPIDNEIRFLSPARSVQYILIDNGNRDISAVEERTRQTVERFSLQQNYPNPFNPQTTISYSLPRASTVTLLVYDTMGREITTLISNERKSAGDHEISFDAENLPSGVYFYRLRTDNFVKTMKMMLIK